ncbi:GCG_CRPN prefix-to-repeats domain-containing protein [Pararobbsia silviterrae]|uniref:Lipoprotein n=1 Tax=Pararobbsia silviterrae TaxID=1792498 RepID=A0A494XLR8_9BURK|nr:hypothetical protein [Pararobbsia silviterrae]RKP49606.1 hypothetical protein D7S86_20135 [Pararobbsia silviterrae]
MISLRSALKCAVLACAALAIGSAYAAQGCGPYGWRGPWGHCRYSAPVYVAPQPVIYSTPAVAPMTCPPGYWPGPWGHCRDTPYHGRLPNGQWQ